MFPFGQDVVVFHEQRDRLGNVTLVEERVLHGCAISRRFAWEPVKEGRNLIATGLTMFCPPGSGLTAGHRVRLGDGTEWVVDGEVGHWASPFSNWNPGDQVELNRITG